MNEENMTFEQQKRREDTSLLFNGIFAAGIFGLVFIFILKYILESLTRIPDESLRFYLTSFLVPACRCAAVFGAFAVYSKRQGKPLRGRKAVSAPAFLPVTGALAAGAASVFALFLVQTAKDLLISDGYVITSASSDTGTNIVQKLFFMIVPSLIYSFSYTVIFDMIVCDKLGRFNVSASVVLSAYLACVTVVSARRAPAVFAVGIIASAVYGKTLSGVRTFPVWFAGFTVISVAECFGLPGTVYCVLCGIAAVVLTVSVFLSGGKIRRHELRYAEEGCILSGREVLAGLARSSLFWIFTVLFAGFIVLVYISDPDFTVSGVDDVCRVLKNAFIR